MHDTTGNKCTERLTEKKPRVQFLVRRDRPHLPCAAKPGTAMSTTICDTHWLPGARIATAVALDADEPGTRQLTVGFRRCRRARLPPEEGRPTRQPSRPLRRSTTKSVDDAAW